MSTFSGLSVALSALYAQQRGLDVTGQNVANVNSAGYTRQRTVQQAMGAGTVPAMWSTSPTSGGGVAVTDVERLRDMFLEGRAHTEHGRQAYLTGQQQVLARVEQAFGEPGDTGLQAQLADLWAACSDVANRPSDEAARAQLVQRGKTLADGIRATYGTLGSQWAALREQAGTTVDAVNTAAANVAELNEAIRRATQSGVPANELADQRDALVMTLADLTGAVARPSEDGMVDVYLGGTALVRGSRSDALDVAGPTTMPTGGTADVQITWARGGYPAEITSGQTGSFLESLNTTIPGYAADLDAVTSELVRHVNDAHAAGYTLDGTPGGAFFTVTPGASSAATIAMAFSQPDLVAASALPGGVRDGGNADLLAALATRPGGPDAAYRTLVVSLGVDAQTTNRRVDIQVTVTGQVDAAREAQAGVSLDEEMTNMLAFQHAYDGAARMLTAVDQALDTLINRTGLVGR